MIPFYSKKGPVLIDWTDEDECLVYTDETNPRLIGNVTFKYIDHPAQDYYLVTNMHLEGPDGSRDYINAGIGRECVRIASGIYPVIFANNDGNRRSDGAHLTDMGPEFARRMVAEGLAGWE
jgi:hypothetical protein